MVKDELGPDDKPVYASATVTPSSSGRENFDQWFRDGPFNQGGPLELTFVHSEVDGQFEYDNPNFFPIDGMYLGNEVYTHNYHFTVEGSTTFDYVGGEVFSFSGDDDMWVFVNRRLAIDLGGLHETKGAVIVMDKEAAKLGMSIGNNYPLHFFFAERHTIASRLTLRTTIAEEGSCN